MKMKRKSAPNAMKKKVEKYMLENYPDHIDPTCAILNTTALAEDAASEFNLWDYNWNIPPEVFDWANDLDNKLIEEGKVNF